MKRLRVPVILPGIVALLALVALGCSSSDDSGGSDQPAAAQQADSSGFQLVSANFSEVRPRKRIPQENTCYGDDLSPPLAWNGVPEGTRSFALIADEPENELGPWIHWVLYNIPAGATDLPAAIPTTTDSLPDGTRQGVNDFKGIGYRGPCPAPLVLGYTSAYQGDFVAPHKYSFRIYALDSELELAAGASRAELDKAMEGHILGQAETAGKYTTSLELETKEGKGFLDTTGGRDAFLTVTPQTVRKGG